MPLSFPPPQNAQNLMCDFPTSKQTRVNTPWFVTLLVAPSTFSGLLLAAQQTASTTSVVITATVTAMSNTNADTTEMCVHWKFKLFSTAAALHAFHKLSTNIKRLNTVGLVQLLLAVALGATTRLEIVRGQLNTLRVGNTARTEYRYTNGVEEESGGN